MTLCRLFEVAGSGNISLSLHLSLHTGRKYPVGLMISDNDPKMTTVKNGGRDMIRHFKLQYGNDNRKKITEMEK